MVSCNMSHGILWQVTCSVYTKNVKKHYNTGGSTVVPDQSTNPAQRCLTSVCWWERVYSTWYDRSILISAAIVYMNTIAMSADLAKPAKPQGPLGPQNLKTTILL